MGLIDKIYKVTKSVDNITSIASKLDGSNLLGNLNLKNFDFNNLGSFGSGIESQLSGISNEITSGLDGVIDVNEIQNIAQSITPADVGLDFSNIDTGIEGLDLSSLGLDKLTFM